MPARSIIYQGLQVGRETTPGTQVAAVKRLRTMEVMLSPVVPLREVIHSGHKGAVGMQRGKQHVEGNYNGVVCNRTLCYIFSSMFGYTAPVTPAEATDTRQWSWTPSGITPLNYTSFSIEMGSDEEGAEKATMAVFSSLNMSWDKEQAVISGTLFGQEIQRNANLTDGLSAETIVVCDPYAFNVKDQTAGGYGDLTKVISGELNLGPVWTPQFYVDSSEDSYSDLKEMQPDLKLNLVIEESAETDQFWSYLDAGTQTIQRVTCQGALIEAKNPGPGNYYNLVQLDIPCFVKNITAVEADGVYAYSIDFVGAYSASEGIIDIDIYNKMTAIVAGA